MTGVLARVAFVSRRLVKAIVVIFAIIVLNFFLVRMTPGDPALVIAGEAGAPHCANARVCVFVRRGTGLRHASDELVNQRLTK